MSHVAYIDNLSGAQQLVVVTGRCMGGTDAVTSLESGLASLAMTRQENIHDEEPFVIFEEARTTPTSPEQLIFGWLPTAMIIPFGSDGRANLAEVTRLARHLVNGQRHDGLTTNGATEKSPTTSDKEKQESFKAVVEVTRGRTSVVTGVGTFDTRRTIEFTGQAAEAGADGLLVVTPYYLRPSVDVLRACFLTVVDATGLPLMPYDIPHRMDVPIPEVSLLRLVGHPRVATVEDIKVDIYSPSVVIASVTLTYYTGDDAHLLSLLAVGGAGMVGTFTHFSDPQVHALIDAFITGDFERARQLNAQLLPVFRRVFATQGMMMVKAASNRRDFGIGRCRPPMGTVAPEVLERFLGILDTQL